MANASDISVSGAQRTLEHVLQPKGTADTQRKLSLSCRDASRERQHSLIFHETLSHHEGQYCVKQALLLRERFSPKTVCDLYTTQYTQLKFNALCNGTQLEWQERKWCSYKQVPSQLRIMKHTFQSVLFSTVLWQKNGKILCWLIYFMGKFYVFHKEILFLTIKKLKI